MGGCVTKGGNAGTSSSVAMQQRQNVAPPTATTPDSPSTRPSDGSNTSGGLKQRERRRLSLSQSDPAKADLVNDLRRGQLLINQDGRQSSGVAAAVGGSTKGGLLHTHNEEEEFEEEDLNAVPIDDEEDEDSLPSSSDSEERHGQHVAAAKVAAKSRGLAVPSGPGKSTGAQCRRLSVSGMPSSMLQENFESKRQEVKSDTGYFDSSTLYSLGIGFACKKGLKPESPNQDDFFIVRIDDWGLYGVFDGHGPYGHDISHYVQRELPKLVYNDPHFLSDPKEALRASFVAVHAMLENAAATHRMFDCSLSGCTATVVLHRKNENKLYAAHVGDSRCVLGRIDKEGKLQAVDLTIDHKPNNEAERKRITASGGQVRRLDGDIPHRVFLKGKLYPGLAMSRAIGDSVGAQAGVICTPDVAEWDIEAGRDLFITICSDGVWEFLSSEEVAKMIHKNGLPLVQTSADDIARESWNRWIQEEGNVVDDITCEIVFLDPSS